MKIESIEEGNLVMFPSAKNFPLKENLSDPLYDLLNEYSHLKDDELPKYLDDRFEMVDESIDSYPSLEAFMNRNRKKEENSSTDDQLILKVNSQINAIKEAQLRIRFYLNEIDIFLPRKR